jgi:thiamine kinase-like enzyme
MLVLDDRNIFPYLVSQKILREEECDQYQVLPLDGKNFSLAIHSAQAKSLIVKQAAIADQQTDPFLGERVLTQLLENFRELHHLRANTVTLEHYDIDNKIVIAPFLANYQDLDGYYRANPQFLPQIAPIVGQTLAQFHQLTYGQSRYRDFLATHNEDLIDPAVPSRWDQIPILMPEDFGQMRQDAFQFFRLVQQDQPLHQAIGQLSQRCRACCLTHQDLRLNNWLIPKNGIDPAQPIRLIDWESVQWGDPIADLSTVLAEYLLCWLKSLNPQPGMSLAMTLTQATVPLETLQPSLQAMLRRYVEIFPAVTALYQLRAPMPTQDQTPTPDQTWLQTLMQFMGRALLAKIQVHIEYYKPFDRRQRIIFQVAKQLLCQPTIAFAEIFALPETDFLA